jgi:hypothetical protein
MPVLTDSYFTDRIREEEKDDSSVALPTKEAIEEKMRWFHEQYAEVKDRFCRWFEELGYTVTIQAEPITMREGYPGDYASVEYRFLLKGGEEGIELHLRPFAIWTMGTEGALDVRGPFRLPQKICYFRKDGFLSTYGGGYEKIDEDGWYWDDQRIDHAPFKLSLANTRQLLEWIA